MNWDLTEQNYPQIEINENHVAGLSAWLTKIIELIPEYEGDWNVIVADLWPNEGMSRLIGHVQMNDVATGYDTGYRVCAYLKNGGILGYDGDDTQLIKNWLELSAKEPSTATLLKDLSVKNNYEIRLVEEGYSKINQAILININ